LVIVVREREREREKGRNECYLLPKGKEREGERRRGREKMKKRRDMVCVRKREIWSEMISFGVFLLVNVVCCLLFRHGGV
jgi:hypothetical protein